MMSRCLSTRRDENVQNKGNAVHVVERAESGEDVSRDETAVLNMRQRLQRGEWYSVQNGTVCYRKRC